MEDAIHTIDRLTVATVLLLCIAAFSVGFSLGMKIALNKIESFQSRLKHLESDALWLRVRGTMDDETVSQEHDV